MESLQHLSQGLDSYWRLRRLELVANYVVKASVLTIIPFCVTYKDVDDLYKWQMFPPSGLYQSLISHVDNNITVIHDIYRVKLFSY